MVAGWMRAAGMEVREDEVGNLIGLYGHDASEAPVLMIGSHLDTVRNAGKWDGMLGVVIGIECVEALRKADRSEERRVGKACVSTCRSRLAAQHKKKKNTKKHR